VEHTAAEGTDEDLGVVTKEADVTGVLPGALLPGIETL
jgi:hypothetical protein